MRLATLIPNAIMMGASTLYRLLSAKNPPSPDGEELDRDLAAGYVRARITGRADWREKKMGKMAAWREANWARGRVLYATTPPMKD